MKPLPILFAVIIIASLGFLAYQALPENGGMPPPPETGDLVDAENLPLRIPSGAAIEIFTDDVPGARVMALDLFGNWWVSQTSEGTVSLIELDRDTGNVVRVGSVLRDLERPHGLLFGVGEQSTALYVAEEHRIIRIATYSDQETPDIIAELPSGGGHYTRTIDWVAGHENQKMLVSIGSSCNVCAENDPRRAKVFIVDVATGQMTEFARGLRNAVFMSIHPVTGDVWATEMGRDHLGDDLPPDEINILGDPAAAIGNAQFTPRNFGWPICYGKNIHDTEFDKNTYIRNPCMEPFETASHIDIPAHSAPLGIAFVPEEGWPEEWWYDALVAYHGSWNRSTPTGYKVVRFPLDAAGNPEGAPVDFVTGWLQNGDVLGRPVDIRLFPGGLMYITDDEAGTIYKLTLHNENE